MSEDNRIYIRPLHVVFCDDIRRENTGKEILIEVYSSNLVAPKFPANVVMSVWVPFERAETSNGEIPIEFRIIDVSENKPLGYGTMQLKLVPTALAKTGALSLTGLPASLTHQGEYAFQMKQHDESWATIGTLIVEIGPIPSVLSSGS